MKRLLTSLVAVLFVGALIATPLVAQAPDNQAQDPQEEPMFGPGHGHGQRMMDDLNLTTEQKEKLHDAMIAHQKEMIPLRADLKVARIELREMIRSNQSKSAIDAKVEAIGKLRTQIEKARVDNQLAMRSILTPEQLKKWDARPGAFGSGKGMMGKDRQGMMERGRRGMMRPGAPGDAGCGQL
jgi:protein CpxP